MPDVGLVAEEVADAEPLLTTTVGGKTEGVKYDRVGIVLINAVRELDNALEKEKETVERQKAEIKALGAKLEALQVIVCEIKPESAICKED